MEVDLETKLCKMLMSTDLCHGSVNVNVCSTQAYMEDHLKNKDRLNKEWEVRKFHLSVLFCKYNKPSAVHSCFINSRYL